jgi:CheY-like chemotaxis protein
MRILLVEDNPADVEFTRQAFSEAGVRHRLDVAGDGDEALSHLRRQNGHAGAERPDLVLLDLNLPGTDGREVLKAVKGDDALRNIPVVVLTSSASPQDVDRCYELHANAYVVKPLIFDRLVDIVGQVAKFWAGTVTLRDPPSVPPAG